MLEIRAISAGYGRSTVLHGASLTVGPGEIVALIGANGAGKSTLAKAVSGLIPLRGGSIMLDGMPLDTLDAGARVRRGLVHVPEGRQVFATLSVDENLALGAHIRTGRDAAARIGTQRDAVCAIFPVLGPRLSEPAGNLSGGQQQMLAIARGLMSEPKFLLLDEPSLGLSPALVADIFRLIVTLRDRGIGILLSEQNARQSLAVADRGAVLESGHVVLSGAARDLIESHDIAARYLGVGAAVADASAGPALTRRLTAAMAL